MSDAGTNQETKPIKYPEKYIKSLEDTAREISSAFDKVPRETHPGVVPQPTVKPEPIGRTVLNRLNKETFGEDPAPVKPPAVTDQLNFVRRTGPRITQEDILNRIKGSKDLGSVGNDAFGKPAPTPAAGKK